MRILFDNIIDKASLIATNSSNNYPVSNITNPFLKVRFQSILSTAKITANFSEDQTINCVFLGFHNLNGVTVTFKDGGGSTIDSFFVVDPLDIYVNYIDKIDNVRSAEFDISSDTVNAYVGGIGMGAYYQMPRNVSGRMETSLDDKTKITESDGGQVSQNAGEITRERGYTFYNYTLIEKNEVIELYKTVKKGKSIYIDAFEGNRAFEAPMYGFFNREVSSTKDFRRYNINMRFKESR